MGSFCLVEHTADMGIAVEGDDLADFFGQAARGLMAVIAAAPIAGDEERRVEVTGEDSGELLVNWLNELLYLLEVRAFVPSDFLIDHVDEHRLAARVRGARVDPGRHPVEREVKAVTYHRLRVAREDGRWRAQVFVDL